MRTLRLLGFCLCRGRPKLPGGVVESPVSQPQTFVTTSFVDGICNNLELAALEAADRCFDLIGLAAVAVAICVGLLEETNLRVEVD